MKITVIAAIIAAAMTWQIQDWRYESKIKTMENDAITALNAANEEHRENERKLNEQIQTAQKNATAREVQIRNDVNRVNATNNSLRDELTSIRSKLPEDSRETLIVRADTTAQLLGECTAKYSRVAEAADRHASDVRKLSEAWPK